MTDAPDKFIEFDAMHPDIWKLFVKLTFNLIDKGYPHGSSDEVLHAIRWHYKTSTTGALPKINNNYTAAYARKFRREYPQHEKFFELRRSRFDQGVLV